MRAFIFGYIDQCWAHIFVSPTNQRRAHLLLVILTNARHTHCRFYYPMLGTIN
ncbi:hypothetical protein ES288_A08G140300v1 [Gossypium darwinii]|uniref:Uncharacterized protein n=1 Tax=Gossypium darwinii TaxID=34276 RepID=A0A5D2FJX8_GOSDA|nr:hypothetical protein ES288_A08G140300v1 [Gossypium darwinii]